MEEDTKLNPHSLTRDDLIRANALGLAAELLRHRGDATADDVVKAADAYTRFLRGDT